jgi:2-polyprenyl-3-methyl-5-hydroxy-6-metoxy-1,4-benzoquinol methylase
MKVSGLIAMLKNRAQREQLYSKAEYWDSKAEEMVGDAVSMWPNNELNRHYHAEQMALVESALPDLHGKTVLDVGCGTGRLSRFLSQRGALVSGIDFSAKAIDIAKRLSPSGDPSFRVMSVFDLQDEAAYDLIFSWGCVVMAATNRDELLAAMRVLRRSMKPGGQALLLEPVHRGFVHRVLNMGIEEFCEVMRESGFVVKWVRQMHFWPMRFALAFIRWPAFITTPCYHVGQLMMKLPGLRGMGDYKAVCATAA